MLRTLDLFSGIGGFSLGLERTGGFEPVAFCEIDAVCRYLLAHHWPSVPRFDDVRALRGADVGDVDVICGGFPCQDISLAGNGGGLAGERSGLWREYARLVGELLPDIVIVENVSALLVRGMGTVLGDLAALGYGAWWDCIPASAVGAPHRRDRLWIVAYARGLEHQGFGDALRWSVAAKLASYANGQSEPAFAVDGEASGMSRVVADTPRLQPRRTEQRPIRERVGPSGEPVALADAASHGRVTRRLCDPTKEPGGGIGGSGLGASVAHAHGTRSPLAGLAGLAGAAAKSLAGVKPWPASDGARWWQSEPDVGRVAHGVPARVDRLHGLGNAVVPAIPELIGRAILEAMRETA
jgi:DNA (cytosine-5)-methyltransferase 1